MFDAEGCWLICIGLNASWVLPELSKQWFTGSRLRWVGFGVDLYRFCLMFMGVDVHRWLIDSVWLLVTCRLLTIALDFHSAEKGFEGFR